ncbi:unnamed protein product [Sordaria macrospora k-hell]|uniref:WGS project CABT00000000 data, contig 2.18 n=1 Tax=Sordaria macrospora (strain ATCC MYA-333 / DSM 997 / K(L3346) / K-hell) TaxID=771870 RepID=F7W0V7_SORMK|nr:uncharacterized protein SMAC_02067 [Sordaria macrospora k-hell]CCC11409.1 unnamed protein product [Sordaria macrospora k-hell]
MFDCYSTLGVSPCAEEKTIKEAYDRLIANAYELLIDPTRRREYDLSVKQQYLGTQARFVEAQKEMHRVVTHRPHGPHDAILWESHGTMTQLAQTMTRLVRELKAIPDEGERERQKEFDSLRRRVEYLQGHVTHDANRIHDLRSKLEQEEKKARMRDRPENHKLHSS